MMHVTGRCHCGEIAFAAEVEPLHMTLCHCNDCQRLSGAAFRANIATPAAAFRLLRGVPRRYDKTAESGRRRQQVFCSTCGSPIYSCDADMPGDYSLRSGVIDQRHLLRPRRHIWMQSAVPWLEAMSDLPRDLRE